MYPKTSANFSTDPQSSRVSDRNFDARGMHHALTSVRKRGLAGEHKQVLAAALVLYIVFVPIGGLGGDDD